MIDGSISRIQFPRATTQQMDLYVGAPGEQTIDSNRNEIRLHDGKKRGGWRIPNLDLLRRLFISADSELGNVRYSPDARGFMVRISDKVWRLRAFVAGDGVAISNLNGVDGNITVGVTSRLASSIAKTDLVVDCNTVKSSGFYITATAATNLPGALDAGNASLTVTAGIAEDDDVIVIQRIISIAANTNTVYTRRFREGAWTSWS